MTNQSYTCAEWEPIGMGAIDQSDLFRHFMFLGETGSGKTVSGIQPLCRIAFDPDNRFNGLQAAGLVVDPKGELGDFIEQLTGTKAKERMIRLKPGGEGPVMWQFEYRPIDGLGCVEVFEQMMTFSESFHVQQMGIDHRYWFDAGKQFVCALIDIDLTLWRHPNGLGVENINNFWQTFCRMLQIIGQSKEFKQPYEGLQESTLSCLRERFLGAFLQSQINAYAETADFIQLVKYDRHNYLSIVSSVLALATSGMWVKKTDGGTALKLLAKITFGDHVFNQFWSLFVAFVESWTIDGKKQFSPLQSSFFRQYSFMASETYSSIHAVVSSLVSEVNTNEFCSRISLNPFESPEELLSTREIIQEGKIVLYEPGLVTSVAITIGKVLKGGFFKALLTQERLNNMSARPFFYICDEFQRFITYDEESGEQSFLDRCRAYRVCCGLATQSIASLRYCMPAGSGQFAVNILMVNTGTKMFFRTTDQDTSDSLGWLMPSPTRQGKLHVVRVRPPTTLSPGECYYLLVNGKAGRGRVNMAA